MPPKEYEVFKFIVDAVSRMFFGENLGSLCPTQNVVAAALRHCGIYEQLESLVAKEKPAKHDTDTGGGV